MIQYIIPLISAFIGWVIVRFYLNYKISNGNRGKMAKGIGSFAAGIINLDSVTGKLKDPEQLAQLTPAIEVHIDTFLRSKLQEKIPVIAPFIGESTIAKLKEGMMEEINILLPNVLNKYADSLSSKLDIGTLVENKINALTDKDVQLALAAPIRSASMAGAWFGFFIGALNLLITIII